MPKMTLLQMSYEAVAHHRLDGEEMPQRVGDLLAVKLGSMNRTPGQMREIVDRIVAAGDYWAVGEFDVEDPEDVFDICENGRHTPSWSRMPPDGVRPLGDGTVAGGMGYRSTMMGDIVVVDDVMHLLDTVGFTPIGRLEKPLSEFPSPKDNGPGQPITAEIPAGAAPKA